MNLLFLKYISSHFHVLIEMDGEEEVEVEEILDS
jgi:hypothetical protein